VAGARAETPLHLDFLCLVCELLAIRPPGSLSINRLVIIIFPFISGTVPTKTLAPIQKKTELCTHVQSKANSRIEMFLSVAG
jgi:hypothetical protein